MHEDDPDWTNPVHPPVEAEELGGHVWVSWGTSLNDGPHPLLWHWCDRSVTIADDRKNNVTDRQAWWYEPRWVPAGGAGHDLISRDPLHLEPSILWPSCCGKHGFIRDGQWRSV